MKLNVQMRLCGLLAWGFVVFLAQSALSEISDVKLLKQYLRSGEIYRFSDEVGGNPKVVLEKDENGATLLEYAIFLVDDDYKAHSYPNAVISILRRGVDIDKEYQELLTQRVLLALRSLDKTRGSAGLYEFARNDLKRSDFVELLVHLLVMSGDEDWTTSEDLAISSILHICDREYYSDKDLVGADAEGLMRIYQSVPELRRSFLESYVPTNILNAGCLNQFANAA